MGHLYTPHKIALTMRNKELLQSARRLLKTWQHAFKFMSDPKVMLPEGGFDHEVKRCVEDVEAACKRLQEFIDMTPDDPNVV